MGIWDWFLTVTGSNDTTGTWYGFWSGFGSDLGEFAIVGSIIGLYRSRICHARWCWRVGRVELEGTNYNVCHKHDPRDPGDDDPPTAEEIASEYREVVRKRHRRHQTTLSGSSGDEPDAGS